MVYGKTQALDRGGGDDIIRSLEKSDSKELAIFSWMHTESNLYWRREVQC